MYVCALSSWSQFCLPVLYILSAVNKNVKIGVQTSTQPVGKRHIGSVGQKPGMLGLMSLWVNRCPSTVTVAVNILLGEKEM